MSKHRNFFLILHQTVLTARSVLAAPLSIKTLVSSLFSLILAFNLQQLG